MKEVIHIHTEATAKEPAAHYCFVLENIQSVVFREEDAASPFGCTAVVLNGQTYTFSGVGCYEVYKRIVMALEGKEEEQK